MKLGHYNITQLQRVEQIEGKSYNFIFNIQLDFDGEYDVECVVEDYTRPMYDETCTYIVIIENHFGGVDLMLSLKIVKDYIISKGYERGLW